MAKNGGKSKRRVTKRRVTITTTNKLGKPRRGGGLKQAKKRSRSAYLDMLENPLASDPAACPDGYTAQTTVFSLQNNGIPIATGAASTLQSLVVNPWSLGRSRERAGQCIAPVTLIANPTGTFIVPNSRVGTQPIVQYFATPADQAVFNSVPNVALAGLAASNVGDFMLVARSAANAALTSLETRNPIYYTGVGSGNGSSSTTTFSNPVISVYDRARPLCAAVKLTYIGPHGDGQKGILFINSAMLGPPGNGVSHFKTLSELKAHPDTVQVRVGADFQVNLYPASDVARGFTSLSGWRSPWGTCVASSNLALNDFSQSVIAVDSSNTGATTPYIAAQNLTVDACAVYPSDSYATFSTAGIAAAKQPLGMAGVIGAQRLGVISAVPLSGEVEDIDSKSGLEFLTNPFYAAPAVAIGGADLGSAQLSVSTNDTAALAAANVRDLSTSAALGQWPLLYIVMEGVPVASTMYDMKVKTHYEAVPQPSVASFITSMDTKSEPRVVETGTKIMEKKGDLRQTMAETMNYTNAFIGAGLVSYAARRAAGR